MGFENVNTKTIVLNTHKEDMTKASENSENLAIDFPHRFGFTVLRNADLFNLMKILPDNAFKLYLYFYSQKEGLDWKVHRAAICKEIGLTVQQYRTAMAKLIELGIIDIEEGLFNGIEPLSKAAIFKDIDEELGEDIVDDYKADIDEALRIKLDEYTKCQKYIDVSYTQWAEKATSMKDAISEDITYKTKKETLEVRANALLDLGLDMF